MVWLAVLVVMAFGAVPCGAVSETDPGRGEAISAFWQREFYFSTFRGSGGVSIAWARREVEDERGALVVLSGRTEFMAKYAEFFFDLKDSGYSFYIHDHRGQGASGRMLADPGKGYVDAFDDYTADFARFMEIVVRRRPHQRLFIVSHSMGGAVALRYLGTRPAAGVSGLVLCSPMLRINTSPLPYRLARLTARAISAVGLGGMYLFGTGPYDPADPAYGADLTHSAARLSRTLALVAKDPANALGGPTFRWLGEAFGAADDILARAGDYTLPILLCQGGSDSVVVARAARRFCDEAPACVYHEIPGAYHELLMESDRYRDPVMKGIRQFLQGNQ